MIKKKILILFMVLMSLLCGCQKNDHGEIAEPEAKEVYYCKTEYEDQAFIVMNKNPIENGYNVTFTSDYDADSSEGFFSLKLKPNVYMSYDFTTAEYNEYIGDYSLFQTSLTAYTVVVPDGNKAKYYTGVSNEKNLNDALREVMKQDPVIQEFDPEYIKKWGLIYYKM